MNRVRKLIIGNDCTMFHSYWRFHSQCVEDEIVGFIFITNDVPPVTLFKGIAQKPIKVYPLGKLEVVIRKKHIERCVMQIQNIAIPQVTAIVNRIISTGMCSPEFLPLYSFNIKSFKPLFVINSVAPQLGKTQLARYLCSILSANKRRVAIIIPMNEIIPTDQICDVDKGTHLQLKTNDLIPQDMFSSKIQWEIEQYQKSGAYRIFITSDTRRAIIKAEQQADMIIYDCSRCEAPFIEANAQFCLVNEKTICEVRKNALWPGIMNVMSCDNIVYVSYGQMPLEEKMIIDIKKLFKTHKLFFVKSLYIPEDTSGMEVFNRSVFIVDAKNNVGASKSVAVKYGASELSGAATTETQMSQIVQKINKSDADVVIVSLQQDIEGIEPGKQIMYTTPEIDDTDFQIFKWMSQYFSVNTKPPLQSHFESQVDILMAMVSASDQELYVTNNESANREAFCRLFLSSHLPQGFRVTTGEIIDCYSNTTGQLDVVIVNNDCPRMTIDSSGSVIAPILADTVLGVIEVKTSLTSEVLKKALSQLRPVKALMPTHGTLQLPDGNIVTDPLSGKIITGIFAFNPGTDVDHKITSILAKFPNVADFIVLPDSFAYFSVEILKVCGLDINDAECNDGYVRYSAKGMGLAIMFGILNSLAATRRFSGSNCVRYLKGFWGGPHQRATKCQHDAEKSFSRINKIISKEASVNQKEMFFRTQSKLFNVIGEVCNQIESSFNSNYTSYICE